MPLPSPQTPSQTQGECPICGRPSAEGRPRPFCSVRCAEVDLGRWFTGAYAIPVKPEELEDESEPKE